MSRPLFTPGKDPVPIVQEAGWAQGRSGQVRKILPPPGFDPRTVQSVASRYTNYATRPTTIFNRTGVNLLIASSKMFTLTVKNVAKDILIVDLSVIAIKIHLQYITRIINPRLDDW